MNINIISIIFWNIHLNVMISFQPRYNRQFRYAISYNTKSSPVWCRDYRTWFSILWQNGNTPESRVIFIKWILSSRVYSYSKYIHIKPILYKLKINCILIHYIHILITFKGFPINGITIFGSQLHTHGSGVGVSTKHYRDGMELQEINRDDHYSAHFQEIRRLHEQQTVLPVRVPFRQRFWLKRS